MRRNGLIILAIAAAAWAVVTIMLGTGVLSGAKKQAVAAPDCLPSSIQHSAVLPGTSVEVSPAPKSVTANPDTQISFLGLPASEVHAVSVRGSESGTHSGRLTGYSQGDGGSFLPSRPFTAGERVSVHATIGEGNGARPVSFSFEIDTPYPTGKVPEFPNPPAYPSEYETFRTLPGVQAPLLTVITPDQDPSAGDVFTSNGPGAGRYGASIYTPRGRLVWFYQLPRGLAAEDVNVQSYEGRQDLTFWRGRVLSLGYGDGEDVVMDSRYQTVAKVRGGNGLQADLHEFQIAPKNVAWVTAYNPIRCNLASVEGSRYGAIIDAAIQAIDMKTGLVRWEWHALDHVAATESENSPESESSPRRSSPWDWFHINSIDPEPDGDVFVSARNTWAGYQIERGSGRILWRLGGERSSFALGPGTKIAYQHDGRVLPNGEVTFFDDGSNPRAHPQSRGVRIALNMRTRQARLRASYAHRSPLSAASQGNMQTLPDGNVLIGWGGVPQISEYSRGGSLLFDAHMPFDLIFYRAYRHPWSGRPATPPAVVANLNNTSEETIVRASWNGATEVAAWRVLAGASPRSLQPRLTFPDTGFESSTILTKKYAYAAVQALSAGGSVLGSSPPSKVISYDASLPSEAAGE